MLCCEDRACAEGEERIERHLLKIPTKILADASRGVLVD